MKKKLPVKNDSKITICVSTELREKLEQAAMEDGRDISKQVRFFLSQMVVRRGTASNQAAV
jgi:hypothetical protein